MGDKISIRTGSTSGQSVVTGKVSGSGNVVGIGNQVSNQTTQITIPAEKLEALPPDLGSAMRAFLEKANGMIAEQPAPKPEEVQAVQEDLEAMVDETNAAVEQTPLPTPEQPAPTIPIAKKLSIGARFASAAKGLLKLLPKTAEAVAAFSPLAPFGKLIGQGVEEIVQAVVKEG